MSLLEPFRYDFFTRGLLAATLVGGLCGLIGVYVVLRRMSYIGHGLSHAVFGGAVASYVMGVSFYVGAGIWGLAFAESMNCDEGIFSPPNWRIEPIGCSSSSCIRMSQPAAMRPPRLAPPARRRSPAAASST